VAKRVGPAVRLAVLAVVVLATGVALAMPASDPKVARSADRLTLVDDDGGRPLFSVPALAPGKRFVRCIQVTYRGDRSAELRLSGDVGGSGLADELLLTVERGSGGGYGSCSGFRGAVVYEGTLAALPAQRGVAHRAADGERVSYRFTVDAAPTLSAAMLTASATFTWQATEASDDQGDEPGGGSPASTAPSPTAPSDQGDAGAPEVPATAPAAPADAAGATPKGDRDRRSRDSGEAGRRAEPAPGGERDARGAPGSKDDGSGRGMADALRRAVAAVAAVAAEGAKRAAFPVLLLLLMAAFLLAQHRLDSRDPKLALAPVHAEPDLPFVELGGRPITDPTASTP
jgi:hypothetical protein